MGFYKIEENGITISIQVAPKSSRNKIAGVVKDSSSNEWLKIQITSPAEDGKANKAMVDFLAKEMGVAKSSISIIFGLTSRKKIIKIADKISAEKFLSRFERLLNLL